MEFERAIYRVYERCLDGLRDEDENGSANAKSCNFLELLSLCFGVFLLVVLIFLHLAFVGSPGCLHSEILRAVGNTSSNNAILDSDQILFINIDPKFRPDQSLRTKDLDSTPETASTMISKFGLASLLRRKSWYSTTSRLAANSGLAGQIGSSDWNKITVLANKTVAEDTSKVNTTRNIEPSYDYKFTFNSGLLLVPYEQLVDHGYTAVNVTLMGSQCYGGSTMQSIIPLGGIDTIVVNALMYTFQQPGHVLTGDGDYFRWNKSNLVPYSNVSEWIQFKIQTLFYSLFAFFVLTTITALMVRILISSGVVLIFPIFWMMSLLGFAPLNLRVVALSYPWIGVPLEIIRSRNQSITPFLIGHMSRVVIYCVLYQCAQIVFAVWFYNRDSPGQQELWIFGVMMVWEYYSMIYVRSRGSIRLFPRVALSLFLVYHFYYFSFPSGFHVLALVTMFFFLVYVMVHCIRVYELKDYERGLISLDQPRSLYNSLPFPVWNGDLAPEFTLMMPVTTRSESAYQTAIPAVGTTGGNANGGGATAAGAGAGAAVGASAGAGTTGTNAPGTGSRTNTITGPGGGGGSSSVRNTVSPMHAQPAALGSGGRSNTLPQTAASASASASAQQYESEGIELQPAPAGGIFRNLFNSFSSGPSNSSSSGNRSNSRDNTVYSRLENQSSDQGTGNNNNIV